MGEPGTKEVLSLEQLEAAGGLRTGRKHVLSYLDDFLFPPGMDCWEAVVAYDGKCRTLGADDRSRMPGDRQMTPTRGQ